MSDGRGGTEDSQYKFCCSANVSMLFTEVPMLERPGVARAAGFEFVESWWPFDCAVPKGSEVDRFVGAVEKAGVHLVSLNFFAGDLAGSDCGLLSLPGGGEEFLANVSVVAWIGARLGVKKFNALYGNRVDALSALEQDEIAVERLEVAARAVGEFGGAVLLEPISGPKPYPLRTAANVVEVIEKMRSRGTDNVEMLCDIYHLVMNGDDISATLQSFGYAVGHVQLADVPGRGEPGSGSLAISTYLEEFRRVGYKGAVGLEYKPRGSTLESLGFLDEWKRLGYV